MKMRKIIYLLPLLVLATGITQCGSSQVTDATADVYAEGVDKAGADTAIKGAQDAYTALGDESSAEAGEAKTYLNKAKEYQIDGEFEAAWSAAQKSKSYSLLASYMKQTRAAGLK